MTNRPNTIASASRHLALDLMDHLRIRTLIVSGELSRAQDLLFDRMTSLLNDYAIDGRIAGTEDDSLACNVLANSPGLQVKAEMRLAAVQVCEEFYIAIRDI